MILKAFSRNFEKGENAKAKGTPRLAFVRNDSAPPGSDGFQEASRESQDVSWSRGDDEGGPSGPESSLAIRIERTREPYGASDRSQTLSARRSPSSHSVTRRADEGCRSFAGIIWHPR